MDMTGWMPAGMPQEDKDEFAAAYPDDPHGAAAAAWESWAATLQEPAPGDGVRSVSTGAQSITYDGPRTASGQAAARARWHRARSRPYSVEVGPTFGVYLPSRYPQGQGVEDSTGEVIGTYHSPPIPPTAEHEVNLPGTLGSS